MSEMKSLADILLEALDVVPGWTDLTDEVKAETVAALIAVPDVQNLAKYALLGVSAVPLVNAVRLCVEGKLQGNMKQATGALAVLEVEYPMFHERVFHEKFIVKPPSRIVVPGRQN